MTKVDKKHTLNCPCGRSHDLSNYYLYVERRVITEVKKAVENLIKNSAEKSVVLNE